VPVTVLIIENDSSTRELLAMLVRDWGDDPIVADTGGDGLVLLEARRPDVVLVDPRLRDGDRFDLVRRAKALGAHVVLMSAFFQQSVADELGVAFLAKPFALDAVRTHVQRERRS
jgi:DNA-binding response OmpR family regulator